MKRVLFIFTLVFSLAFIKVASADNLKIGVVDFQNALNNVEEGKAAKSAQKYERRARKTKKCIEW